MTRPHADLAQAAHAASALHHVMVVGGTASEWAAMSSEDWDERVGQLGGYCASIGVPWLTFRVFCGDAEAPIRGHDIGGCSVTVDAEGDGRKRFAEAMNTLDAGDTVTEKTVNAALYGTAEAEPDLLVVLGPPTQLPPSLVWELAYAELVFMPVAWSDFGTGDLAAAVADFAGRRRRFGGLDDE